MDVAKCSALKEIGISLRQHFAPEGSVQRIIVASILFLPFLVRHRTPMLLSSNKAHWTAIDISLKKSIFCIWLSSMICTWKSWRPSILEMRKLLPLGHLANIQSICNQHYSHVTLFVWVNTTTAALRSPGGWCWLTDEIASIFLPWQIVTSQVISAQLNIGAGREWFIKLICWQSPFSGALIKIFVVAGLLSDGIFNFSGSGCCCRAQIMSCQIGDPFLFNESGTRFIGFLRFNLPNSRALLVAAPQPPPSTMTPRVK